MKVGRNQPCPYGSGKKYKKCCLGKEKVSSDLLYTRLGEAHDRLAHHLMRFGLKEYGEEALGVALDEFMAWPDEEISDGRGNWCQTLNSEQVQQYSLFKV